MPDYHKIKKVSAADQVYDELKRLIIDEAWKTGEKIPTETQLAKQFDVNRLTVRVALQRLQAIGLLDIRVGSGTYVKEFDMCGNIDELSGFYSGKTEPQDLREYRSIIESECVRLAVSRRTEEDLEAYWNLYQEMEVHVERYCQSKDAYTADQEMILQADMSLELHTILCAMAHNELLNYAFSIAKEPIRQLMLLNIVERMRDLESGLTYVRYYKTLYNFIRDRDLENSLLWIRRIMNIDNP